jgi:hypothetical protein
MSTCTACGEENRDGRKFCAQCGARLAPPAGQHEVAGADRLCVGAAARCLTVPTDATEVSAALAVEEIAAVDESVSGAGIHARQTGVHRQPLDGVASYSRARGRCPAQPSSVGRSSSESPM